MHRWVISTGGLTALCASCSLVTPIPDLTSGAPNGDSGTDADSLPFCAHQAPAPMFCDDFDQEPSLTPRWDALLTDGPVSIDHGSFRSKPASLLSTVSAPGSCNSATANKLLAGSYRVSHAGIALRVGDASDLAGGARGVMEQSFTIHQGGDVTDCNAIFTIDGTRLRVYEQVETSHADGTFNQQGTDHELSKTLALGVWHRVVVDYDLASGRVSATLDGEPALDEPLVYNCPKVAAPAGLKVGLFCVKDAPHPLAIHIDDVTFDAR